MLHPFWDMGHHTSWSSPSCQFHKSHCSWTTHSTTPSHHSLGTVRCCRPHYWHLTQYRHDPPGMARGCHMYGICVADLPHRWQCRHPIGTMTTNHHLLDTGQGYSNPLECQILDNSGHHWLASGHGIVFGVALLLPHRTRCTHSMLPKVPSCHPTGTENWSMGSPPSCLPDTELLLLLVVVNHRGGNAA